MTLNMINSSERLKVIILYWFNLKIFADDNLSLQMKYFFINEIEDSQNF